jgi:hypothetical protein
LERTTQATKLRLPHRNFVVLLANHTAVADGCALSRGLSVAITFFRTRRKPSNEDHNGQLPE